MSAPTSIGESLHVVVADGRPALVRAARPDDAAALREFHSGLSRESIYLRYFSAKPKLSNRFIHHFTHVDAKRHIVLFAFENDRIIAMASSDRLGSTDAAAVAFCVADDQRRRGLATALFEQLVRHARVSGVRRFVADTMVENKAMQRVFEESGFELSRSRKRGVVHLEFDIAPTARWRSGVRIREHLAESLSVTRLLSPRSIAVIGDGPSGREQAAAVLARLVHAGFSGRIWSVGVDAPFEGDVHERPAASAIEDHVDLVVVASSPESYASWIEACTDLHAFGVMLVGAPIAVDARRSLATRARRSGLRLLGPDSAALVNNDPAVRLVATPLADVDLVAGDLGVFAESRPLTEPVLSALAAEQVGVSSVVALGQRSELSSNDVLQYWQDDASTAAGLLAVETLGNAPKFARIARELSNDKPVVVLWGGAPDPAIDALFEKAGVIKTTTLAGALMAVGSIQSGEAAADPELAAALEAWKHGRPAPHDPPSRFDDLAPEHAELVVRRALAAGGGRCELDPACASTLLDAFALPRGGPTASDPWGVEVELAYDPTFGTLLSVVSTLDPTARGLSILPIGHREATRLAEACDPHSEGAPAALRRVLERLAELARQTPELIELSLSLGRSELGEVVVTGVRGRLREASKSAELAPRGLD